MNLQFSLTSNKYDNSVIDQRQVSERNIQNQDTRLVNAVKSGEKLSVLEKQGVQIPVGQEQLIRNIDRAVKALEGPSTSLEISVHEKTHAIMVKVINKETGQLIREIPPEKTLDLVAKMMEIAGILVDEKV
ncbi:MULTISPECIES: flagellar protein FlaG [Paenibacillus]|jgi:flagellar protein FlaG|uniref:Flagellar biosynthesis protein FlaG n=1 Tax=Paenibacillus odorifer TaxID=189426 RepID=A0ABX3GEK2_9BACL|nr:flagellar protein FlaG [Paenibacillus odorifer]MEC0133025.1 flagellar protein FlaG [Paenibacillus odorifer]MEC0223460.1 flagellar protein FlaG [Paenibacillus odorifer]OMC77568.1 flagellar biosynthesis protein FlaG [Paenibacillus odorifer]OMC92835.1 flagellar biosynthesis protein FlaG [Paenibacillus odorifer]OMC97739.1 flagellar biosynthesis protein FlaG [Paenibacillus odorifer]